MSYLLFEPFPYPPMMGSKNHLLFHVWRSTHSTCRASKNSLLYGDPFLETLLVCWTFASPQPPPNDMLIWVSKFMQDFTESKNHWTLYIVQWTLYIGQSTLNNVQCTTDILHWKMDIVHCTTGILNCTMDIYIIQWTLFIVQWTFFFVQWTFTL